MMEHRNGYLFALFVFIILMAWAIALAITQVANIFAEAITGTINWILTEFR